MLKYIVDSLDSVNEQHRGLYVKNEETGKYQLQVEGVVPKNRLDEFRDNNITLTNEKNSLADKLKSFEGIDPTKWSEYKTKAEAFKGDQDIDKIVQARLEAATKAHGETVQELTNKLTETTGQYYKTLIGTEVRTAALKAGALPAALIDIENRANGAFSVINGKAVIMKDGQPVYGADGVNPMSPFEWAKNLAKEAPYFFADNHGGGGKGGSFNTEVPRDQMTAAQKIAAGLNQP